MRRAIFGILAVSFAILLLFPIGTLMDLSPEVLQAKEIEERVGEAGNDYSGYWQIKDGYLSAGEIEAQITETRTLTQSNVDEFVFIPYGPEPNATWDNASLIVRFTPDEIDEIEQIQFPVIGQVYSAKPSGSIPTSVVDEDPRIADRILVMDYKSSPLVESIIGVLLFGLLLVFSVWKLCNPPARHQADAESPPSADGTASV